MYGDDNIPQTPASSPGGDITVCPQVLQALSSGSAPTRLVIAHRLKTVEEADHIAVIGQGRVLEQGSHRELMEARGSYYQLWEKLF